MSEDWFEKEVNSFLKETVEVHKRRCAIRAGVRESYELEKDCSHSNWCFLHLWCKDCGVTMAELQERHHKK